MNDLGLRAHAGEQAVQRRVGEGGPGHGSPMFGPVIPAGHGEFIADRRMVVLGAADEDDTVWATMLSGHAGFAKAMGERAIRFSGGPAEGDPLRAAFENRRPAGILAIDQVRGRRIRANGWVRRDGDGLRMETAQVLRNCPKYIQKRELVADAEPLRARETSGTELTARQREWIAGADTFFIASYSPDHGADVSHRGGTAGFVSVGGSKWLSWPDYTGNSFYMTLGNLELNPACGLLFVDWRRGHTLHLTGESHVDWQDRSKPGAKRTVHFSVRRVVQVDNATVLRWRFVEKSPFNP